MDLILPYPPSVNHYYIRRGRGVAIGKAGREYRAAVATVIADARVKPIDGRLLLIAAISPPDRRKRDLDNVCKALLDALQHGGAFIDDAQIDSLHLERRDVVRGGRVAVHIEAI